jgi:chromosome segregation ATPase
VQNDVENIRKQHNALEKSLVASRKDTVVLKRKLNGSQMELQELKEKNRKQENESATLEQKCRDLENELETSWMDAVDTSCVEVAELNKTHPVESDVPDNSGSSGTNSTSQNNDPVSDDPSQV